MTDLTLHALCFDALDPQRLVTFWAGVLGWQPAADRAGCAALLPPGDGFRLRFLPAHGPKVEPNQMHFDLTSQSWEEQQETVTRVLRLGGRHFDVGQLPEEQHVVLADPEDNEFCVIEPGNNFLAGCGVIGALSSDGSHALGLFWSRTLGWPLVWDEGEETAIQAPSGGSKIAWGGSPVKPKVGRNRLHFDLTAPGDLAAAVDRLVALGANRLDAAACDPQGLALADPDGNEFCVLPTTGS